MNNDSDETIFFGLGVLLTAVIFVLIFAVNGATIQHINPQKVSDALVTCEINGQGAVEELVIHVNYGGEIVLTSKCGKGGEFKRFVEL